MTWPTKDDFVDGDVLTAAQVNNIGTNLNEIDPTGITDGYVLTADGAGSMGWEAVVAGGWTLINSGTMSGSSITSSTFSGYKQVHIDLLKATHSTGANLFMRLNGLTTNIYGSWSPTPTGATTITNNGSVPETSIRTNALALGSTDPYSMRIDIYGTDTAEGLKVVSGDLRTTNAAFYSKSCYFNGHADISATISSVTVFISGATWTAGNYYIWGLK